MKKPGEFHKSRRRHKIIQKNRDSFKLLREGKVKTAILYVMSRGKLAKFEVQSFDELNDSPRPAVVLTRSGLRAGTIADWGTQWLFEGEGFFCGLPPTSLKFEVVSKEG
jgi:hypothetical protein